MTDKETGREHKRVHTRKIDRAVAHARMKAEGIPHINKSEYTKYMSITGAMIYKNEPSLFSKHWKAYVL